MSDSWSQNPYAFNPCDVRFERKFITEAMSLSDLDILLRGHPGGFLSAFQDRWVNNIYLDTENLNCYQEHIRGCSSRAKFRIRWYGDLHQERARPVLEIKRKKGMVGSKLRFDLGEFNSKNNFNTIDFMNLIRTAGIDERIVSYATAMNFVVGNRYQRKYYVTSDQNYRVTIDRNLQFMKIPSWRGHEVGILKDSTVVLELKYLRDLDIGVEKITKFLPIRVSRMSKYIHGIERLKAAGYF